MTNEERVQANAEKGYILVKAFDGWEIYKKKNEVGGWSYYSDQFAGHEGAYVIWDTAVNSLEELEQIAGDLIANDEESGFLIQALNALHGINHLFKVHFLLNPHLNANDDRAALINTILENITELRKDIEKTYEFAKHLKDIDSHD